MSFRWIQFWGDLRQGTHPGWRERLLPNGRRQNAELRHYNYRAAAELRNALYIAKQFDVDFTPDMARWAVLSSSEFGRWCEAVGLLSLGDHLRKIVSPKTLERMQVSLDRQTLTALVRFLASQPVQQSKPLPLVLPVARELGERALAYACVQRFPQLWSRLKLRLSPKFATPDSLNDSDLVFAPNMAQLQQLDAMLFDAPPRSGRGNTEDSESPWNHKAQTLLA